MLWGNLEPGKSFEEHVRAAAAYFRQKYGRPALCRAPREFIPDGVTAVDGLAVKPADGITPRHLWICSEEAS